MFYWLFGCITFLLYWLFYIFHNSYSPTLTFLFHQKHKSSSFFSLFSFIYKPSLHYLFTLSNFTFGFRFAWWVPLLFFLFLAISMSSNSENNSNSLYHEYLGDDDDYCHISSDHIPFAVILVLHYSFLMNNLTSNPTDLLMGWRTQFLRNPFRLLKSSMKFQVQLNLGNLKLVSSPANLIRTPSRTDVALINLVPKIESKPRMEWNIDQMLIESTNLGMWRRHNQLWMVWLISQEFERHENPMSSKRL